MFSIDLSGRCGVVFGIANQRSIAWWIAQTLAQAGMRLALTYQNERLGESVMKLAPQLPGDPLLVECDVSTDGAIEAAYQQIESKFGRLDTVVHSIAFAHREELAGDFTNTSREGFSKALEISAYSLIPCVRYAAPLLERQGGSVVTMSFLASTRAFPGYNVMGTAKAALEHEVRQLAAELGPKNIRVNAVSAGPLDTLAARGIHGFIDMKRVHQDRSPMQRNITHQEVANAALFLVSDLASGITGDIMPVDAGYSIMGI